MIAESSTVRTILLADDDGDDREFFEDALAEVSTSVQLQTARNGIEALEMLESAQTFPDLIFLDLNMPLKNGYECLQDIKANKVTANIPVVIFSTSLDRETAEAVYSTGANGYLIKPNNFAALKKTIARLLAVNWQQLPTKENFIF